MRNSVKLLACVLAFSTLCGCASVVMSRAMPLKPGSAGSPEWVISGKAENGPFTDYLTFYINEKEVAKGELGLAVPRKTFSWVYEGEKIEAECSLEGKLLGHDCTIYRNGQSVTTLKF